MLSPWLDNSHPTKKIPEGNPPFILHVEGPEEVLYSLHVCPSVPRHELGELVKPHEEEGKRCF